MDESWVRTKLRDKIGLLSTDFCTKKNKNSKIVDSGQRKKGAVLVLQSIDVLRFTHGKTSWS